MKTSIKGILFLILFNLLTIHSFANPQLDEAKKLGLVSYITTVQELAEHQLISLASKPAYLTEKDKASELNSRYNVLRLSVDKLINQISADMIEKNKLKTYKCLNKFIKGDLGNLPKKLNRYKALFEEIDANYEALTMVRFGSMNASASLEEITGAVGLVHTIITDMRDFREKKVANIIKLLETLKMQSIKNVLEPKKEKKDE